MAGEAEVETNDSTGQTDLRTTLETAYEAQETADATGGGESPVAESRNESPGPTGADPEQVGRPRDEHGRFTRGEKAQEAAVPGLGNSPGDQKAVKPVPGAQPAVVSGQPPPGTQKFDKAPPDWGAKAREHWGKLPPEAREEAWNRHVDARRALSYAENIRKQAAEPLQNVSRIISSFPSVFQGKDVFQELGSLAYTANQLMDRATPGEVKARLLADWMDSFGIPEQLVAQAIDARRSGRPAPQYQGVPQQRMEQYRDPRVDQLFSALQQQSQQEQLQERESARESVLEFRDGKEFYDDVRGLMADIIDTRHRQNPNYDPDLTEVYTVACGLHPQVAQVMKQREEAQRVSTQRARAAAGATLRTRGVVETPSSGDNSIRSLLESQIDEAGARR